MFLRATLLFTAFALTLIACSDSPEGLDLGSGRRTRADDKGTDTASGNAGTGTTGNSVPAPAGSGQGATMYMNTVDASLRSTCASCHVSGAAGATVFMRGDANGTYALLTDGNHGSLLTIPANSQLLLHGLHSGPALTDDQKQKVTSWLDVEAKERNLAGAATGGPPPMTTLKALEGVAQCFTLQDFATDLNGVSAADLAAANTNNQGQCRGCHARGEAGFWASGGNGLSGNETTLMFERTKELPYIKKFFTGTVGADGKFKALEPSNSVKTKADVAAACTGRDCHPRYELTAQMQAALDAFVNNAITKWNNKQCGTTP